MLEQAARYLADLSTSSFRTPDDGRA